METNIDFFEKVFEEIKLAKENKKHLHIKNFSNSGDSWASIIDIVNKQYNSEPEQMFSDDKRWVKKNNEVVGILIYNTFDLVVFDCNKTTERNKILQKTVYDFLKFISYDWSLSTIVNFVGNEGINNGHYYAHKDLTDIVSIQSVNTVEYRFYENEEDLDPGKPMDIENKVYESIVVNPGDIVYIPAGVIHQAVVTEPRATFIINLNDGIKG